MIFAVFVTMGALAGLAALLNAVRFADVDPNAGPASSFRSSRPWWSEAWPFPAGAAPWPAARSALLLLGSIAPALVFLGTNPQLASWREAAMGESRPRTDHPACGRVGFAFTGRVTLNVDRSTRDRS